MKEYGVAVENIYIEPKQKLSLKEGEDVWVVGHNTGFTRYMVYKGVLTKLQYIRDDINDLCHITIPKSSEDEIDKFDLAGAAFVFNYHNKFLAEAKCDFENNRLKNSGEYRDYR